ncbi:MAG: 1-(5-phosphoribosyl)-5-[(5-phosphoribosylamino)methylideneamino]imidazole-4-carboxamide isomerase [Candidatus Omnitrophica bacterium]|nr:1-(5-phosphoribosyl)-5-[(5-phosphoribosylamino)methylideneamino]imidazole-4-carboxamide isomerase [Candidatus Omnitrophota bacterium]
MLIIPAIDLKDGCVVRYVQGRTDKKVYSKDPLKTAKHWARQGAEFLHIVDLDGAFSGVPKNIHLVKEIAKSINIPVEFGGGVRDMETITSLLDADVKRVILGTKVVEDKIFLENVLKKFKDRIIIGVDAKENKVMIKGWKDASNAEDLTAFANLLKEKGCNEIIYTDTLKDGTLTGPNIKGIKSLLKETGIKIIASGGISCLEDLRKLKLLEKQGVTGVIVGKALYEGKFTLAEALKFS